jgi:hypothetical protein
MIKRSLTSTTKTGAAVTAIVLALSGAALAAAAPSHTPAAASLTPLDLDARVMQLGELPGFWSTACPIAETSAAAWAAGDSGEATALRAEGFVVGVRESVRASSGASGASVALRFRSAAGATADLDRREQLAGRAGYATNFAVPESDAVRAYTIRGRGLTTVRVAYQRGVDEYAVEVDAPARVDVSALQRKVAAAVVRVAARR